MNAPDTPVVETKQSRIGSVQAVLARIFGWKDAELTNEVRGVLRTEKFIIRRRPDNNLAGSKILRQIERGNKGLTCSHGVPINKK